MSGFYSKNIRELGSQVPDFLHVWHLILLQKKEYRSYSDVLDYTKVFESVNFLFIYKTFEYFVFGDKF